MLLMVLQCIAQGVVDGDVDDIAWYGVVGGVVACLLLRLCLCSLGLHVLLVSSY